MLKPKSMFYVYIFVIKVFVFSAILIEDTISTNVKDALELIDGELLYANYFTFPKHKLWTQEIESRSVNNYEECIAVCTEIPQCRSVNFKAVSRASTKSICFLLDTDKFRSSRLFNESRDFDHYSLGAPCDHSLCQNNGTCVPVYEEKTFRCACVSGYEGRHCEQVYKNCKEIVEAGFPKSGVYPINQSEVIQVYCDQTNSGGGWTMVFKAVPGGQTDIYELWSTPGPYNENNKAALKADNSLNDLYKSRLVDNWQNFAPKQVRVSLYENGFEVVTIVFNATDSTSENWFSKERLISSPWIDIKTEPQNFFSLLGDFERRFYINRSYGGCELDLGWLMQATHVIEACAYETRFPRATFTYSKLRIYAKWSEYENVGVADFMAVYIR